MDFSWLADPVTWLGFATLIVLEVVLGIDNLVFVAILANKVKPQHRDRARVTGLMMAVLMRLIMLGFMVQLMRLTAPLFTISGHVVSGAMIVIISGFLRRSLSANCIITSSPCDCCSADAQPITAIMVNMTDTGGSPGSKPKMNTMISRPKPDINPSPIPP